MKLIVLVRSLACLAPLAAPLPLAAQSSARYYVDVGALGSVPSSSYGAAAGAAGVWNGFSAATLGAVPLLNASGGSSGVTLAIVGGQGNFAFNNAGTLGDDGALMDDTGDLNLAGAGLDTALYTFSGMPNGRYRVFVYAWAPDVPVFTTSVQPSGGRPCTQTCGGANWSGAHVEGATYVVEEVSVSTGQLTVSAATDLGWGSVNGIQVVPLDTTRGVVMAINTEPTPSGSIQCPALETLSARGLVIAHDHMWVSYSSDSSIYKCIKKFETPVDPPTAAPSPATALDSYPADHAGPMAGRVISSSLQLLVRQPDTPVGRVGIYSVDASSDVTCDYIATLATGGPAIPKGVATDPDIPGRYWSVNDNGEIEEYFVSAVGGVATLLSTHPYPFPTCFGLAYDWVNDVMWAFTRSNDCGTLDHLVEFRAFDPSTGVPTGERFMGAVNLPLPNRALAASAAVHNGQLAIAAMHECAGANYFVVYDLGVAAPIPQVSYCTAGTSTSGCNPAMSGLGIPSASLAQSFSLAVSGAEGQKLGLVFYGVDNAGFLPSPWGAGSSFLCVKAPTQRMGAQNSGGTAGACDGSYLEDWNAFQLANPGALGAPFAVGDKVYVQAWYRDPPAAKSTNLSNALELTLQP